MRSVLVLSVIAIVCSFASAQWPGIPPVVNITAGGNVTAGWNITGNGNWTIPNLNLSGLNSNWTRGNVNVSALLDGSGNWNVTALVRSAGLALNISQWNAWSANGTWTERNNTLVGVDLGNVSVTSLLHIEVEAAARLSLGANVSVLDLGDVLRADGNITVGLHVNLPVALNDSVRVVLCRALAVAVQDNLGVNVTRVRDCNIASGNLSWSKKRQNAGGIVSIWANITNNWNGTIPGVNGSVLSWLNRTWADIRSNWSASAINVSQLWTPNSNGGGSWNVSELLQVAGINVSASSWASWNSGSWNSQTNVQVASSLSNDNTLLLFQTELEAEARRRSNGNVSVINVQDTPQGNGSLRIDVHVNVSSTDPNLDGDICAALTLAAQDNLGVTSTRVASCVVNNGKRRQSGQPMTATTYVNDAPGSGSNTGSGAVQVVVSLGAIAAAVFVALF